MKKVIYFNPKRGDLLTVEYRPRRNLYSMTRGGWYGGQFSAASDTEALETFKRILREEAAL